MKKSVAAALLIVNLVLGPANHANATSTGEYQVYGLLLTTATVVLGIGSALSFAEAGRDTEDKEQEKDFYHGLFMGLGAVGTGTSAAYCFNHTGKHYGAFLTLDSGAVALSFSDISLRFRARSFSAEIVEVRF